MADRPIFLYAAVYDDIAEAELDYDAVFELHAAGLVGTFDSAVIEKEGGEVHVHKTEKPTQHGAWTGIAVGAIAGILFPPSIIGTAIAGELARRAIRTTLLEKRRLGSGSSGKSGAILRSFYPQQR